MDYFINVALVLLILAGAFLCVYVVIALKRTVESIVKLQNDISKLIEQTLPVLQSLEQASSNINRLSNDIERRVKKIDNFTETVKERFASIVNLKENIAPAKPIIKLLKNLSAIQKGVASFLSYLKQN